MGFFQHRHKPFNTAMVWSCLHVYNYGFPTPTDKGSLLPRSVLVVSARAHLSKTQEGGIVCKQYWGTFIARDTQ